MALAVLILLALAQSTAPPAARPTAPPAREIAAGTFLLPGAILPERGPDGNTVVFVAPAGLVVVDTGRHPWHSDGILAFAAARRAPIAAIVNTHWHLDHSSGNGRVKAAHPKAPVYATAAVVAAIAPEGFLARNLAAAKAAPIDPTMPAVRSEERALFLATMAAAADLRPDVTVTQSGAMTLAGRPLAVRVAANAVTAADIWLYDETTRVAVLGDLVTLPAPFFETACSTRWDAALDEVWATPFALAVPGHGAPMTRPQFDTYRQAFRGFRACVAADTAAETCAEAWTRGIGPLLSTDEEQRDAATYAAYYVDFLRKGGGAGPGCEAQ
ncbi:MAG TPA: MBL fold metallo-hydrolase [Vicinamibacterales bacterium]|nr:MBL fold metallo-hydrolase [Vicinamibacterales bacterium]